jgi:hypothetical protein
MLIYSFIYNNYILKEAKDAFTTTTICFHEIKAFRTPKNLPLHLIKRSYHCH